MFSSLLNIAAVCLASPSFLAHERVFYNPVVALHNSNDTRRKTTYKNCGYADSVYSKVCDE